MGDLDVRVATMPYLMVGRLSGDNCEARPQRNERVAAVACACLVHDFSVDRLEKPIATPSQLS